MTNRRWFADMKVPNYWLLNYFEQSLECLVLEGKDYRVDTSGRRDQEVGPRLLPSLAIPLARLWED